MRKLTMKLCILLSFVPQLHATKLPSNLATVVWAISLKHIYGPMEVIASEKVDDEADIIKKRKLSIIEEQDLAARRALPPIPDRLGEAALSACLFELLFALGRVLLD